MKNTVDSQQTTSGSKKRMTVRGRTSGKSWTRWAVLVGAIGLIAGSTYFLHRFQIDRLARSVDAQAAHAVDEGNFEKAATLYAEHVAVVPDDIEIKLKYAETLLKGAPTPSQQLAAFNIFNEILNRYPGREDVRKQRVELKFTLGNLSEADTQVELQILLDSPDGKRDGHLLFLLGRCCEANKNDARARECYAAAIKNQAPEKIAASERLATLLRDPKGPNDPQAADDLMDEMVWSASKDYQVYVARARYRRQFHLPGAKDDIEQALSKAGGQPEVYLEMARDAETSSDQDQARRIMNTGLKKLPTSVELISGLAYFEMRTGHLDQAIETLERALKSGTNDVQLHWAHADLLAVRGETGKLLFEIEELKNIGLNGKLLSLITGHYYVNTSKFPQAREALAPLESLPWPPELKARISVLLARSYGHLGEPELRHQANLRALAADPQNVGAKLDLIDRKVKQGEVDEALNEYRSLAARIPKVRLLMAPLLITQIRQKPVKERDWREVETLLDDAQKLLPEAVEPYLVRAEFELDRDKPARAREILEKARSKFPKSVTVRCAQANVMAFEKKLGDANRVLDEAGKEFGDIVELRLQRARLLAAEGGPKAGARLKELSERVESFSKGDRRELFTRLAGEFVRREDSAAAVRLLSRLAEQDPDDVETRLTLFDLALKAGDKDQAGNWMKQIQKLEGDAGSSGTLCEVVYLTWQAERAGEKDQLEAERLRSQARVILSTLQSRRPNLSAIPVAFARLEQQSLRQAGLTDAETKEKEGSIIASYQRAISLGQRSPKVVRETVRLLCKQKRFIEALDLVRSIPVESQLASDLEKTALSSSIDKRDLERAEVLARKAVAAKPADLSERMWLVRILMTQGRQAEAEAVIHEAVSLAKADPDRWTLLVVFLIQTKQPAEALKAIKTAESVLPASVAPLALANCYSLIGGAYGQVGETEKQKAYAQATEWYRKALADHPDDPATARSAADFFGKTNQTAELEAQLEAILKRGSKSTTPWARRRLALLLASSNQVDRVRRALSIMEPSGPAANSGQGSNMQEETADLRTLVRVLVAQKTVGDRTRAIGILESLVAKNRASREDRLSLARLEELSGHWPKALAIYHDPKTSTLDAQDAESIKLRPIYLARFARGLVRHHKPGDVADLAEAQQLVDELARLRPNVLETLVLRVDVYRAQNEKERALELIQRTGRGSGLAPLWVATLARLSEQLDELKVAERFYRRYAALPKISDGALTLAAFLGRHDRVNDALDVLAPLWGQTRDAEALASTCFQLIAASEQKVDDAQFERVAGWLNEAINRNRNSARLVLILGNLRTEQKHLEDATKLYRQVVDQVSQSDLSESDRNAVLAKAHNNLAWLATFHDVQAKNGLAEGNRAISLVGPQAYLLDTRGLVHLSLRQTKDAIDDFESAARTGPSPKRLFHLSQAYFQANQKDKSKQFLQEAKAKGLDRDRGAVHWLERPAYQKLLSELELGDKLVDDDR